MSLTIETTPSVSLQDILMEQQQGTSVIRSAHIGNARGYNLALAELGIPFLLVDHTLVAQAPGQIGDKNYLPGSIVTLEGIRPLAVSCLGELSLKTTAICPESGLSKPLDLIHTDALRQAFPNTVFTTNTAYLRANETIAQEVIATAQQITPELFTRKVDNDGTITEATAGDISTHGILQLKDDPRSSCGVLVPNEVDIVINFLTEALASENNTQIHVAGPDMPSYMKKPKTIHTITRLFDTVARHAHIRVKLPKTTVVKLVPSHHAEFVTTKQRAARVAAVFSAFKPSEQDPRRQQDCAEALQNAPELLIDVRSAPYTSQHDLIREGGLWMPDENQTLTMSELKTLAKRLRKIKGQSLCQPQSLGS
jgi:hypothetical protein